MSSIEEKALTFATKKHENQTRVDGTPYITHPISVANYAKELFKNDELKEELVAAAYLHDTIEDTNTTYEEIAKEFGYFTASLVLELTNNDYMKNLISKAKYLSYKMVDMTYYGLCLKLLDRKSNVKDLINADEKFRIKYIKETTYIIDFLLNNRELDERQKEIVNDIIYYIKLYNKTRMQLSAA
ncbi:MAG: bifunctional (p)ppGpp synthetase/guanosine-3',5'-bis(diphosphate) 3'-pyrophosphohydrolase [Bacilli bacterium]|nr:bifunctional (p)ppGpp synthetase/guanosine-3',5'-bis(diphosphate) 3'-pyrophosphohydrolase [Bacilli bacterium]